MVFLPGLLAAGMSSGILPGIMSKVGDFVSDVVGRVSKGEDFKESLKGAGKRAIQQLVGVPATQSDQGKALQDMHISNQLPIYTPDNFVNHMQPKEILRETVSAEAIRAPRGALGVPGGFAGMPTKGRASESPQYYERRRGFHEDVDGTPRSPPRRRAKAADKQAAELLDELAQPKARKARKAAKPRKSGTNKEGKARRSKAERAPKDESASKARRRYSRVL